MTLSIKILSINLTMTLGIMILGINRTMTLRKLINSIKITFKTLRLTPHSLTAINIMIFSTNHSV